jgi:hypothetical protein
MDRMTGVVSSTDSPAMNRFTTDLVTGAAETVRRIVPLRDAARITGPSTGHLHEEIKKSLTTWCVVMGGTDTAEPL